MVKNVNEIVNENTEKCDPEMAETISMVITKKCIFVLGLFTLVFDVPQRKLIVTHVDNRVISHVCVV